MKKKKYILFSIILLISIGFAYLSTNLNITGSSLIKGNTWDVHFENVQVTSGSVQANTPTITNNAHQVNYTVTLDMPGDYFEFTVDAVNDGTIDAMVDTVSNTGLTADQLKYLDYTVKLTNDEPLNHGYILLKETTKTYKVRLEYKLDISEDDLPSSDQTISLTFTVNYIQTDESAYTTSTFIAGEDVGLIMNNLVNSNLDNIKAFLKASQKRNNLTNDNIASTTDSDTPIYLWFEEDTVANDGTGSIYWYSEADFVYLNQDSYSFFFVHNSNGFRNMTDVSGLSDIVPTKVHSFEDFFFSCRSLNDLTPIEDWNIVNATDIKDMFGYCYSLTDISPIENWNISNVNRMMDMFRNCYALTDLSPLANWDVSNVDNLGSMFSNCKLLEDLTPLSNWTFKENAKITYLFSYCEALIDLTPIANWDISNITELDSMFGNCILLSNLSPLSNWNTGKVQDMSYMFNNCTSLTNITPLSNWNTTSLTNTTQMFKGCTNLTNITALASWNISNVTKMWAMFSGCSNLSNITSLTNWNVSSVTDMSSMFANCTSLTNITPLSNWNTRNAIYILDMFNGCTNLSNATALENWDVSNVYNMRNMFANTATTSATRPSWYV